MRVVLQRVGRASVHVDGAPVAAIEHGLLALVGVGHGDDEAAARWMAAKLVGLRIFTDDAGRMNRSVQDEGGSILVVSQFTLLGNCRKGRRPSFVDAARPDVAAPLVQRLAALIEGHGVSAGTGEFGAHMHVELLNDGPVTLVIDSP